MKVVFFNFDVADWIEVSKEYDGNNRKKKYDIHEKFIIWAVNQLKEESKRTKLDPKINEEILLSASKIVPLAPVFDDTGYVQFIIGTLKQKGYHIKLTD